LGGSSIPLQPSSADTLARVPFTMLSAKLQFRNTAGHRVARLRWKLAWKAVR